MIGSSGSYFRLSSNFNFDYLQNIKLLAKVGIPSLQLQVVLLDSIWYLQGSSKESTLLEFKYLFHKIPVERVYHIWGDLIKHNTLNMLFWIWPQPGSNSVFFILKHDHHSDKCHLACPPVMPPQPNSNFTNEIHTLLPLSPWLSLCLL